ncbi:hypothetical protein FACS189430_00190 [Bacteroidia bacterium]|nr:hypothetical protein FACS189430_00190 [Bacteroidia bacterium]
MCLFMYKFNLSFKSLAAVFMMSAAVVVTSCRKDKDKDEDKTVPVTDVTLTSAATTVAGEPLTLAANVEPATATSKTIVWTVKSAGNTGATIAGNVLNVPNAGTATVTATIAGGLTATTAYTKDFDITVTAATPAPTLSLTPAEQTEVQFAADGTADGNATFTVTTNTGGYEAVASASWVTVTKTETGFTLVAAANTALTAPDAATVTVTAGTATAVVLAVTQAAAAPTLALSPAGQTAIAFAADGTTANNAAFTITTNTGGYEAVASASWVTVEKTETGFTVSAAANASYTDTPDAATVTVSATGATSVVLSVTQSAKAVPADGVLINGVVWAKYNVDDFGTFAATPEAAGKFYQWNRNVAWAATGTVTGWDDTVPAGTSWETANDPSPEGWRVPTRTEMQSLFDAAKVTNEWVTTPVNGRLFTDIASGNTLFLPVAGLRDYSDGTRYDAGTFGYYWSSTANGTATAYNLLFYSGNAVGSSNRRYGFSVRSVAE